MATPAIEDFDTIRDRLAQIKKEQEEAAAKATPDAPNSSNSLGNSTTNVPLATEAGIDYCCGYNELSTKTVPIIVSPGDYLGMYSDFAFEHVFEDYTLDEFDSIVETELPINGKEYTAS